ncbi:hypothetical protein Efla_003694 [Eimeria flavescens]
MSAFSLFTADPHLGPFVQQQQQQEEQQQLQQQQQQYQQAENGPPSQALKREQHEGTLGDTEETRASLLTQQLCQPQQNREQQQHLQQQDKQRQQDSQPQHHQQHSVLFFCIESEKQAIPTWEWTDTQVVGKQEAGALALDSVFKASKAAAATGSAAAATKTTTGGAIAPSAATTTKGEAATGGLTTKTNTAAGGKAAKEAGDTARLSAQQENEQRQQQQQHQSQPQLQPPQQQQARQRYRSTPPKSKSRCSTTDDSNKRRRASAGLPYPTAADETSPLATIAAAAAGQVTIATAADTEGTPRVVPPPPASGVGELSLSPSRTAAESSPASATPAQTAAQRTSPTVAKATSAASLAEEEPNEEVKNAEGSHLTASLFLLPILAERRLVVSAFTAPCLVQSLMQQRSKLDIIFDRGHGSLYQKARDSLFPQDAPKSRHSDNRAGDKLQEIVNFLETWCHTQCTRCSSSCNDASSSNSSSRSRPQLGCGLLGVLRRGTANQGNSVSSSSTSNSKEQPPPAAPPAAITLPAADRQPAAASEENDSPAAEGAQIHVAEPPPAPAAVPPRVFVDVCGGPGAWSLFLLRQLAPRATAAAATTAAAAATTAAARPPADSLPWATGSSKDDVFAAIAEEVRRRLAQPQKQQQQELQQQQRQDAEVFGFGMTLKFEDSRKGGDWYAKLKHHANFKALWGRDGTGDVYSGANLLHAQQTIFAFLRSKRQQEFQQTLHEAKQQQVQQHQQEQQKHQAGQADAITADPVRDFEEGVALVVADGGFALSSQDGQHVENYQELLTGRLLICEFLLALLLLQEGGHFVLKIFDCFSLFTASLVYCVSQLFEHCLIVKPFSSRAVNSERYLVGLHLKSRSSRVFASVFASFSYVFSLFQNYAVPRDYLPNVLIPEQIFLTGALQTLDAKP